MQELNIGKARYAIIAPAVAMVAALGSTGLAQIAQPGARDLRPPGLPKPAIVAPSQRLGLVLLGVPTVRLGPLDVDALLAEDAAQAEFGSKALRVSIARDILLLLRDGEWHDVDGGSLWVADILAEGAVGLRLHFTGMDLPPGAEVVVTGSDKGLPMKGPFTKQGLLGDGAFWSGSTLGERARIEYFVPDGEVAGGNPIVPFAVDSLQHVYVDFYRGGDGGGQGAGPCHNQPACFPAWDDVEDSVGRIFIAQTGTLCSGQLVNAVNSDLTPYYLTARHCINTASEAASAEVVWQFERRSCGGAISGGSLSDVCSLVSTFFSADETLLMVEGSLPLGLYWSGWQSSATNSGTLSTGIHHPAGDYKRISFGTKFNNPNCGGSSTNFLLMSWTDGVTEGGSSGSGIWRDSNQLLFGTLTCGISACPDGGVELDSYGRFDRAYNAGGFSIPLAAGSDDAFENNDSCATAAPLPQGTFPGQVVKSLDEDWYSVTLPTLGNITVDLTFTHLFGDIDMELLDACGGAVVASAITNTNNETLSFSNFAASGQYFLRIFLDHDTRNQYTLTASSGLLHNLCAGAPLVLAGSTAFSNVGASTDGPSEAASCNFGGDSQIQSDIWYRYFAQCDGTATISVCGSSYDTKIAVYGADCPVVSGTVIACNNDFCGLQSEVSFTATVNTFYRIRIGGHLGAQGIGTLTITCGAPPCPEDVNGDGVTNVLDLIALLLCFGQAAVPGCEAEDINADGSVNVLDLIDLLLAFGQVCP